jgi:hypothetical protein
MPTLVRLGSRKSETLREMQIRGVGNRRSGEAGAAEEGGLVALRSLEGDDELAVWRPFVVARMVRSQHATR